MKYYPLSQIETGFTSKTGEFKLLSPNVSFPEVDKKMVGSFYVGNYFKTSDGKFFTGKNPSDPKGVVELQQLKTELLVDPNAIQQFKVKTQQDVINKVIDESINQSFFTHKKEFRLLTKKQFLSEAPLPPKFKRFAPTEEDYIKGEINRYFTKHITNNIIIEISKDTYDSIKNKSKDIQHELYKIMSIKWLLVDYNQSSEEFNKRQINIAQQLGFTGLRDHLRLN